MHDDDQPLAILETLAVRLDDATRNVLINKANQIRHDDLALQDPRPFGTQVSRGIGSGPRLIIEDHNWIRLFEKGGDIAYSYRALLLAKDGDQVAVGVRRCPAFEHYCEQTLGLGSVEILHIASSPTQQALTTRCLNNPVFLSCVSNRAKKYGELNIIPYMGIEAIWHLACLIAESSGAQIRVAAPFPHVTRCINDKAWFADCVASVIGKQAEPRSTRVNSMTALCHSMADLTRTYTHIAVKLVDSASSAGNIVISRNKLMNLSLCELRDFVTVQLNRIGWRGLFPLLVSVWESPVCSSPSVHLWIPLAEDGVPVVEAIFDQSVIGDVSEFNGATPSQLGTETQLSIATDAVKLATVFQQLGYFGRCSLDAILIGERAENARLHWIECNGRWGGVSIPMTLANRLTGDWRQQGLIITEEAHLTGRPCDFHTILSLLKNELYIPGEGTTGVIILSPGRIENGSGYELMMIDACQAQAITRAQRVTQKLRDFLLQ